VTAGQELRTLLAELYAAFGSGDAAAWTEHAAEDIVGIGSDADEWWQGRDTFTQVVTAQMREISGSGGRLLSGEPQIFEEGPVAWAVDRPTLRLGDGTEVQMRATVIADVCAGSLRIRHGHFSVGVGNEEVFAQDLTTR
jgi:ketosteroid isomerase-like protein